MTYLALTGRTQERELAEGTFFEAILIDPYGKPLARAFARKPQRAMAFALATYAQQLLEETTNGDSKTDHPTGESAAQGEADDSGDTED